MVLALTRRLSRFARTAVTTAVDVMTSLPRLAVVLTEMRDAVKQIERLATFAAQELPDAVYQLEHIREQLADIERRLAPPPNGAVSPGARRTGSRRPS